MSKAIDRQQIAQRAYQLFEQRGKQHGNDFNDWVQAEQELSSQQDSNKQSSKKK
jgi:hypothetical protein